MKRKLLLIASLACVPMLVGGTVVIAAGGTEKNLQPIIRLQDGRTLAPSSDVAAAQVSFFGQASGGGCRLGFDTEDDTIVPTGDVEGDEAVFEVVSGVVINKPCPGVVVGQFVTETSLSDASGEGALYAVMVAECVAKAGYSNPCTTGQQVLAYPGVVALDESVQPELETRSMNAVFPNLKRGRWAFMAAIHGDGTYAQVSYRTFHVEAFSGGPAG